MSGSKTLIVPGVVVGLAAEARLARRLGWPVAVGGGSAEGAARAAERLVELGVSGLVSFGLAGGLDPNLQPGTVIVPVAVHAGDRDLSTDPVLSRRLGGATPHRLLGADSIAVTATDKLALWQSTWAAAVDLESSAVARIATQHGLPFAVLRAICDPANRTLPPAALAALDHDGAVGLLRVLASLVRAPSQLSALLALARDAAAARTALARRIASLA
jgi:adenosylhomocysteine nucleosidase